MPSVFLLAAGLGTRLRPLTDHGPKAGVLIGDRSALEHVIAQARAVGPVVVNAFHHAEAVVALARAAGASALMEARLLGTAGGLRNAAALLGEGDVLVWNADIQTELDCAGLLGAHAGAAEGGALATLAVAPRAARAVGQSTVGQGTVGLDAAGRVVRLRGEVFGPEHQGADFLGIHVIGAELREALPEVGCLVGDVYLPALRGGARLDTFGVSAPFIDVGTLASYLAANLAWLQRWRLETYLAASARVVPGVQVRRSVVGAGASVAAELEESVVWPGAEVSSPTRRAIVTRFGTFAVEL